MTMLLSFDAPSVLGVLYCENEITNYQSIPLGRCDTRMSLYLPAARARESALTRAYGDAINDMPSIQPPENVLYLTVRPVQRFQVIYMSLWDLKYGGHVNTSLP